MQLHSDQPDASLLAEIGKRFLQKRLNKSLSQADLAALAGVSKRTVERVEAGASVQLVNWLRILRALDLLAELESLLAEDLQRPMDLLRQKRNQPSSRKRVSRSSKQTKSAWNWEDEA